MSKIFLGRTPLRHNNQSQYNTFHNLIKLKSIKTIFSQICKCVPYKLALEKIFLMCLKSAQVFSESLLEHFILKIPKPPSVASPNTPQVFLWHIIPTDPRKKSWIRPWIPISYIGLHLFTSSIMCKHTGPSKWFVTWANICLGVNMTK